MVGTISGAMQDAEISRLERLDTDSIVDPNDLVSEVTGIDVRGKSRSYLIEPTLDALLAAPLFYDRPFVSVCGTCSFLGESPFVRWMSEEEMIFPVAYNPYRAYSQKSLAVLSAIDHVSQPAIDRMLWIKRHQLGDTCVCGNCMGRRVGSLARLSKDQRAKVRGDAQILQWLPTTLQNAYIKDLKLAVMRRNAARLEHIGAEICQARLLNEADALGSVPQLPAESDAAQARLDPNFVSEAIGIAYNDAIDTRRYLELVKANRGMLSFLIEPNAAPGKALQKLETFNEEVNELAGSKRVRTVIAATNILGKTKSAFLEALVGGGLGLMAGGVPGAVAGALGTPCLHQVARVGAESAISAASKSSKLTAAFFGASLPAVQVWKMRAALGTTSKSIP